MRWVSALTSSYSHTSSKPMQRSLINLITHCSSSAKKSRDSLIQLHSVDGIFPSLSSVPKALLILRISMYSFSHLKSYKAPSSFYGLSPCLYSPFACLSVSRSYLYEYNTAFLNWQNHSFTSNALVTVKADNNVARFCLDKPATELKGQVKGKNTAKQKKMSKKTKVNELRFYRLKAKKKMTSPNPEVRIRYKLEKAKRKEEWLIEKLRKFEVPKAPEQIYDPEILTEEEQFYLKRTGEKKKNYVPVGRRGVFGGVVLNMHLHWKRHETVKVVCKPCRPGQVHVYAEELARLSKGIVIDIKPNNVIIFYRGKNYVQPEVMSPPDTLSKSKALEKYRFEQSLEHTSQFIEKLEKELEDYHRHVALYKKGKETPTENLAASI